MGAGGYLIDSATSGEIRSRRRLLGKGLMGRSGCAGDTTSGDIARDDSEGEGPSKHSNTEISQCNIQETKPTMIPVAINERVAVRFCQIGSGKKRRDQ